MNEQIKAGERVRVVAGKRRSGKAIPLGRVGMVQMTPAPNFKPDGKPTHFVDLDGYGLALLWPDELERISSQEGSGS